MNKNIGEIYTAIAVLRTSECWTILNEMFFNLHLRVWRTDIDMLKSYAAASLPAKNHIPNRAIFINTCKELHPTEDWSRLE
jgi:hypothetical protein